MRNSSVFFISSLSFLVIQFSDRFMIDLFYGKKMVGVYSAYSQFVNAIDVFVFTAIIMVMYPKLIKLFSNKKEYTKLFKNFKKSIFFSSYSILDTTSCVTRCHFLF